MTTNRCIFRWCNILNTTLVPFLTITFILIMPVLLSQLPWVLALRSNLQTWALPIFGTKVCLKSNPKVSMFLFCFVFSVLLNYLSTHTHTVYNFLTSHHPSHVTIMSSPCCVTHPLFHHFCTHKSQIIIRLTMPRKVTFTRTSLRMSTFTIAFSCPFQSWKCSCVWGKQ